MNKAVKFTLWVCTISWLEALVFHLATGYTGIAPTLEEATQFQTFCALYMFNPLVVAMIMQALDGQIRTEQRHKFRLRLRPADSTMLHFRPRWSWAAAWLIAPVTVLLAILIDGTLFGRFSLLEATQSLFASAGAEGAEEAISQITSLSPAVLIGGTIFSGLIAGATINALFAFGEEYGWRYYMVEGLRGAKFLKAALLIGIVWGLWHAPMILMGHNYPDHRILGIFMMVALCILLGVVELYFVLKSGTVWPAAIFHGTINALAGLNKMLVVGTDVQLTGVTGLSGFIALSVVIVALWLYDRFVGRERILSSTIGHSLGQNKHQ